MTELLDRTRTGLTVALVLLSLALVTAIIGGILRPAPPVGYAAVDGNPVLRRIGTGTIAPDAATIAIRGHALGIAMRCNGTGPIRVSIAEIGVVESGCTPGKAGEGAFVLSDIPDSTTAWQVRTGAQNRWSLVLTRPYTDGASWTP